MAVSIPFNYIAPSTLIPGFFFEVHAFDNSGLQSFQTLLMGQVLGTGSLGPISVATSATSALGSTTLTFTSVQASIVAGMSVEDLTASVVPAGTTVVSKTSTTVTISQAVTGAGVGSGDSIRFAAPVGPVLVTSVAQAKSLFGEGSMLANMINAYRSIDTFGTLYALPLLDAASGVKASGTITMSGTVTFTQNIPLYVAGISVPVTVTSAMTNAQIAVAMVNAINGTVNMPVVASGTTFPITLTARHAGTVGNDIDVRVSYYGGLNAEAVPVGMTFSSSGLSGGATNPSLTAPLASLGSVPFDVIAAPYVDSLSLGSMSTFLNDQGGRWSPFGGELFGHYFTVANATVGGLTTLSASLNDQHLSVIGSYKSPTGPDVLSALIAANASVSLRTDPGVPLNGLPLVGALAPAPTDQFTISDRNTLLTDGIATLRVAPGNSYVIDRCVTTYTQDSNGFSDSSYQNCEKLFTLAYSIKYTSSILSNRFQRCKLAHDGSRVPVGSNIVTPSVVKGTLISIYGDLCDSGLMDGGTFTQFTQTVQVQINATNPNMLDVLMPVTPIHQLETVRISLQLVL